MKGPCRFQFVARSFGSIGPPASACLELRAKSEGGGSSLYSKAPAGEVLVAQLVGVLGDELACSLQRLNIGIGADGRRPASSACTSTVNGHDLREMAVEERREFLGVIPLDIRIQFSQALPIGFDTMPSSPA